MEDSHEPLCEWHAVYRSSDHRQRHGIAAVPLHRKACQGVETVERKTHSTIRAGSRRKVIAMS